MDITLLCLLATLLALSTWQFLLRRKAIKALEDAKIQIHSREGKIATILNNAPIVFSAVDKEGIFHISEGKGLEKLGRKNNQSVGLSIFNMHNQNPIILDAVKRALNGEMVSTSFVLNEISYDLFMGPERNLKGQIIGATMLSVDITERKNAEKEKAQLEIREQAAIEAGKLKSEFLANMSHEIRTPINGVLGLTTLLADTPLNPQQKEYVQAIKYSGNSLLGVINDILDFSKIEAGKLDFEEIDFDLPELLRHSIKNLEFAANDKKIKLHLEIAPDLYTYVRGDPGRFRQVLSNLVSNAIKFTKQGSVRVRVKNADAIASRLGVKVEVQDTGIGISKEAMGKMFQSFSQAETSMARRFGGTGLGLSISKQLVEKMGGGIGVESEENVGSTFWFTIPFQSGSGAPVLNEPQPLPSLREGGNRPRILVAEDNQINQMITTKMLEKIGCDYVLVADGAEAIKALEEKDFDLVLMDCQMPVMDGFEATRRFRARGLKRNLGIPILALTANAMQGDREACLQAGMNDHISKPVKFEQLSAAITLWMEVRRRRVV